MSATFYFASALSPAALSGTQSVWSGGSFGTVDIWSGGGGPSQANSGHDTSTTQFSSQSDVSGTAIGQTAAQAQFVQSFVSPSLAGSQTLNSGTTYTVVLGSLVSNANSKLFQSGAAAIVYQFPAAAGTATKLISSGFISGFVTASTTSTSQSGTITGLGASGALNSGDRLVLEIWWISGQDTKTAAYTNSIQFASGNFGYFSVNQAISLAPAPPSTGITTFPIQPEIVRSP